MQLDETQHVFPISGQQNFPNAISSSHIQISWNVIFSNFSCNFLTQFFFFLNIQFPRTDPNFPAQLFNTTFPAKIFKFHATHITSKFFIRLSNTSFEVFLQRFSNSFDQRNILIQYFFFFFTISPNFRVQLSFNFHETYRDSIYKFPRLKPC